MCLKVTIEVRDNKKMPRIWITCPTCEHKDWYYSLWIGKCDICGATFGNIRGIYMDLNARLDFHSNGI